MLVLSLQETKQILGISKQKRKEKGKISPSSRFGKKSSVSVVSLKIGFGEGGIGINYYWQGRDNGLLCARF
jgi:hypothetical protein